jgi:hypothetical protein
VPVQVKLRRLLLIEAAQRPEEERSSATPNADLAQALFQVYHPGTEGVRVNAWSDVEQAKARSGEVKTPDEIEDLFGGTLVGY